MQVLINGKEVGLKMSMWVLDEDRISTMLNEKPTSVIWKFVSYFFITHKNFCRYSKIEPVVNVEDIELYVDEQLGTKEGREGLNKILGDLVDAANALGGDEEKKSLPNEQAGEQ